MPFAGYTPLRHWEKPFRGFRAVKIPTISVAMPVFNGARFLPEAIASILSQTTDDLELIVSDDGSSDRSLEIARAQAAGDSRVIVLASPHGGIARAMNRALAAARGEFFAPMDQDDISLPERLETQLNFLTRHPDIALLGGGMRLVDANGNAHGERLRPTAPEAAAGAMLTSCAVIHPASMMRTSAVRAVGGYRPVMPFAQDYDLWLRLMERYQIANIADIVLLKRIHSGAVTQSRSLRAAQVIARSEAYLSYFSRVTLGKDIVSADETLLSSATRFINQLLICERDLPSEAHYNISRFMRYAPLMSSGTQAVDHPYWRYLNKLLQQKNVADVVRALWYAALYFGFNRWRQARLTADPRHDYTMTSGS